MYLCISVIIFKTNIHDLGHLFVIYAIYSFISALALTLWLLHETIAINNINYQLLKQISHLKNSMTSHLLIVKV